MGRGMGTQVWAPRWRPALWGRGCSAVFADKAPARDMTDDNGAIEWDGHKKTGDVTFSLRRWAQGTNTTDELKQKPETEEIHSRDPNEGNEEEDNGGADPAVGKEKEISAQNPGNGAASADGRDLRHGVCSYLKPYRSYSGCQVEE